MRAGLLSMFLLSLVATDATPQTQLHELIARAGTANAFCPRGLREIRQHTSASLGGRQTPNLRRIFLDQWSWPVSRPTRTPITWRAPAARQP